MLKQDFDISSQETSMVSETKQTKKPTNKQKKQRKEGGGVAKCKEVRLKSPKGPWLVSAFGNTRIANNQTTTQIYEKRKETNLCLLCAVIICNRDADSSNLITKNTKTNSRGKIKFLSLTKTQLVSH